MKIKVKSHLFDDIKIKPKTRDRLWFLMSKSMDEILDDFYELLQHSDYRILLQNIDIQSLKSRQKEHWRHIIIYDTDKAYSVRLKRMHKIHQRIGLPNRHYITAYIYFLNKFEKSILSQSSGPKEAFKLISALHSIFAEDISRALEVQCK